MNILFVALEFPPLGGIPVRRSMAFVRYLPEFGVTPIVVTTDRNSLQQMFHTPIDDSVLAELGSNVQVERISCPSIPATAWRQTLLARFYRSFFSVAGDPHANNWRPHLKLELDRLVATYSPSAIYVSLPPFSLGPLWCSLASTLKLPLILDFRDAWSQLGIGAYWSRLHYAATLRREGKCLNSARRVICSSDQILADFLAVHPDLDRRKCHVIHNGFETEIGSWPRLATVQPARKFVVGYVGSFYYTPEARDTVFKAWWRKRPHHYFQYSPRKEDWLYRSPYFFFRSVQALLKSQPELRSRLRIHFAGKIPPWLAVQVSGFGLNDLVEFRGFLSHEKALKFQTECDALLVTSSKVIGGRDYSIAGKTFEYFESGKPILAFVAEGAQKDILVRSGLAVICDPDDIAGSVLKMGLLIGGQTPLSPNIEFLRGLHRRCLTGKLARIIHGLTDREPASSKSMLEARNI